MIVCHKYKFIFLKTNKTASTSVEIALSRFCDKGDIVTHLSAEEEQLRSQSGGLPSQRSPAPWTMYNPHDWYNRIVRGKYKQLYYNHIPAGKLKKRLDPEIWNFYYKFCVERNPWDRVISQYFWRCRNLPENKRPTIDAFLKSTHVRSLKRKGYQLYTINGKIQVDKICRYEHLSMDLEEISRKLGLPRPLKLPKTKATFRKDRRHYREVLTPAQADCIARLFADEIRLMGYEF